MQVKPKLVVASRALADVANKFKNFEQNHEEKLEAEGQVVFNNGIDHFLNNLKLDSGKFLADLDD